MTTPSGEIQPESTPPPEPEAGMSRRGFIAANRRARIAPRPPCVPLDCAKTQ